MISLYCSDCAKKGIEKRLMKDIASDIKRNVPNLWGAIQLVIDCCETEEEMTELLQNENLNKLIYIPIKLYFSDLAACSECEKLRERKEAAGVIDLDSFRERIRRLEENNEEY